MASPTAVTVGTPYSRPTMAACDRVPPPSHTQAAILAKAGVQFGEVDSQTSTSPGLSRCSSSALCRTRAIPRPVPLEAGTPVSVLTCAAGADRLHGPQEVAVQPEDLDQDRVVDRLRDGADHLGQARPPVQPVVEVLLALLDQAAQPGVVRPAPGRHVHDLFPEQVQRVVLVVRADPVRDALAGPPHRQRDAQVDVVVVVVLPPREVRRPARGQAAVEELLLLQRQGGPGRVDGRLALLDGGVAGLLEVVVGVLQQERLDRAQRRGGVLDPARQRDVARALGAPAVDLQEVVELGQPGAGGAAVGGQRGADPVGLVGGEHLVPGRPRRAALVSFHSSRSVSMILVS